MKIRRIQVRNFRNLRDIEIFPSNTTVIIGENCTGKSNLIYALRLLLDPDAKRLELEISEDDINDFALSVGETSFSITVEIGDLQKHQELEAVFMPRIARDGEETYVTIEGKYEKDEEGAYNFRTQILSPEGRRNDPIEFKSQMRHYIPLYYLGAVRDAEKEMRATGRGSLSRILGDISLEDVEDEIIKNIRNANEALGQNQDINKLVEAIGNLLSPHIPGGEGEISIAVATEDPVQLVKGLRLSLRRRSDLRAYEMYRHGTGLQNLVLIAMFRHQVSADERICPILAIEEPEAHLHPQAQSCLFEDLKKIKGPVLLTTHSSAIVECCDPRELIRLVLKNQNEARAYQLDRQRIEREDLNLFSRMIRSGRADILFARSIIIVEGASDAILVPAFADQIGCSLHRDGISVASADSNYFQFILGFCDDRHLSIPAVIIFDTDALKSCNDLLKQARNLGLISSTVCEEGKDKTAEFRLEVLKKIGWIPAIENSEEEVLRAGYLQLILKFIEEMGELRSLNNFLFRKKLSKDATGIARFLNAKGDSLKVPVAREVANAVESIGKVPECFKEAITKSIELAKGGTQYHELD
ncbi:MAG: AAA family ATPase [Candidatus Methanofastidiosia archaeon]